MDEKVQANPACEAIGSAITSPLREIEAAGIPPHLTQPEEQPSPREDRIATSVSPQTAYSQEHRENGTGHAPHAQDDFSVAWQPPKAAMHFTPEGDERQDAEASLKAIMEQVQVYASSYSLVGGKFDDGTKMQHAEEEKAILRELVAGVLSDKISMWCDEARVAPSLNDAWERLCNADDRTSPVEHPDMCLITRGELGEFMRSSQNHHPITRYDLHQVHRAGDQQQRGEMVETRDGEYVAYDEVWHFLPPFNPHRDELFERVASAISGSDLGWKIVATRFHDGVPVEHTLNMTDGGMPRIFVTSEEAEEYAELRILLCQAQAAITAMNGFKLMLRSEAALERLQAILDWCDLAVKNRDEFDSHGVRLLTGPVFDAARIFLAGQGGAA